MRAVHQVMLINGMDPTIVSIFFDLVDLERRMISKSKRKFKLSSAEDSLRKVTLDNYLKR